MSVFQCFFRLLGNAIFLRKFRANTRFNGTSLSFNGYPYSCWYRSYRWGLNRIYSKTKRITWCSCRTWSFSAFHAARRFTPKPQSPFWFHMCLRWRTLGNYYRLWFRWCSAPDGRPVLGAYPRLFWLSIFCYPRWNIGNSHNKPSGRKSSFVLLVKRIILKHVNDSFYQLPQRVCGNMIAIFLNRMMNNLNVCAEIF